MLCCRVSADFADLLNMVSISTLFAFWIVALALLWYRCIPAARNSVMSSSLLVLELTAMVAACIGMYIALLRPWSHTTVCHGTSIAG